MVEPAAVLLRVMKINTQVFIVGLVVLVMHVVGWATIPPPYAAYLGAYLVVSAIGLPQFLHGRLHGPQLKLPDCHYCGKVMRATQHKCECGGASTAG